LHLVIVINAHLKKILKKVNKIMLSNCEEVNIICDSLISNFEIINSVKIKVQVNGVVNAFMVDGSNEVLLHLSKDSAEAQYYTSKSTEVKVRIPKEGEDCDYSDHLIPEQFVFTLTPERRLVGNVSDIYSS